YAGDIVGQPLRNHAVDVALDEARLRWFVGTTNHWAGYCRPLDDVDFERRPDLPISAWPIGPDDLTPWYERAAEVAPLPSPRFDLDHWRSSHGVRPALHDDDRLDTTLFQVRFPFPFGAAYRDQLEGAHDVRV